MHKFILFAIDCLSDKNYTRLKAQQSMSVRSTTENGHWFQIVYCSVTKGWNGHAPGINIYSKNSFIKKKIYIYKISQAVP